MQLTEKVYCDRLLNKRDYCSRPICVRGGYGMPIIVKKPVVYIFSLF